MAMIVRGSAAGEEDTPVRGMRRPGLLLARGTGGPVSLMIRVTHGWR
jgi:hypothetical protein